MSEAKRLGPRGRKLGVNSDKVRGAWARRLPENRNNSSERPRFSSITLRESLSRVVFHMLKSWLLVPGNGTLFGNQLFADKVSRMRSDWRAVGP